MSNLWNHLAQFEPTWTCPTDAAAFHAYRDRSRLRHFLMSLPPDYEHIQASLLHRHPLPTVGQALTELRSEETSKKTMAYQHSQSVLATPAWAPLPPPSQSVRVTSSKNIPSAPALRRNIVVFVDETLILMKTVAPTLSPNVKGTTTVRLLLSLILLGHLLILLLSPLLLLMSRP
ncbi:hypothetical protein Acr_15g0007970 [Actinidia rufa]|uniref:Uncharacterized protein n=1 Tax=Actinidia rufa TaxID=165716 RepID=A0A7J0FW76_9ERIC|nr:hypothetical protein Acr_15g0007970 [Actinidia rufa]